MISSMFCALVWNTAVVPSVQSPVVEPRSKSPDVAATLTLLPMLPKASTDTLLPAAKEPSLPSVTPPAAALNDNEPLVDDHAYKLPTLTEPDVSVMAMLPLDVSETWLPMLSTPSNSVTAMAPPDVMFTLSLSEISRAVNVGADVGK